MNFCQKHLNHHCVHSHECRNPKHQKSIDRLTQKKHTHKGQRGELGNKTAESCVFIGGKSKKDKKQANNKALLMLHQKQLKICELAQADTAFKSQIDKLTLQNKHLYAQIQYYRQQFSTLIETSNHDAKDQIKKRIKEQTDFSLKIKSLQISNFGLKSQCEKLRSQLQLERTEKLRCQELGRNKQTKCNDLQGKLKNIDKKRQQFFEQIKSKSREYELLEERYDILKKQLAFDCEKNKKLITNLTNELESTKKDFNKLKSASQKDKQLMKIQITSLQKREQTLKEKLGSFQSSNKQLFNSLQQLKVKNEELEDELYHAKKIIDKGQENNHQFETLRKQLDNRIVETNIIIKEHRPSYLENKQNINKQDEVSKLQEEIKSLREKIIELEKRGSATYEEVVLNIGASEAFRKLVEEKNLVIKKLMRQKGQIYAKLSQKNH